MIRLGVRLLTQNKPRRCSVSQGWILVRTFLGGADDDDLDDWSKQRTRKFNKKLNGLISTAQYNKAVQIWKEYRANLNHTPFSASTYHLLLRLSHLLGSWEAVEAVRQDMSTVGVVMDMRTGLAYVKVLLELEKLETILEFIEQDLLLRANGPFISNTVDLLTNAGYAAYGLKVYELYNGEGDSEDVMCARLRALTRKGQDDLAMKLLSEIYPDISCAPLTIIADIFSLTNKPEKAYDVLSYSGQSITLQSMELLMEATLKKKDVKMAVLVFNKFWELVLSQAVGHTDISIDADITRNHLVNIINSVINLQSIGRFLKMQSEDTRLFLSYNFYNDFRKFSLLPNQSTYEALMSLACTQPIATKWAGTILKILLKKRLLFSSNACTSWTSNCTKLCPTLGLNLLVTMRQHIDMADIRLNLSQYRQLLGLHYEGTNTKDAIRCIKLIEKMMKKASLLTSTDTINYVLSAYSHVDDMGPMFTYFSDLRQSQLPVHLSTYNILIDTALRHPTHRNTRDIIYRTWRLFLRETPAITPDILLINKLIQCCRHCGDIDRAFYFMNVIEHYNLQPNLETFKELRTVCLESGQYDRLSQINTNTGGNLLTLTQSLRDSLH